MTLGPVRERGCTVEAGVVGTSVCGGVAGLCNPWPDLSSALHSDHVHPQNAALIHGLQDSIKDGGTTDNFSETLLGITESQNNEGWKRPLETVWFKCFLLKQGQLEQVGQDRVQQCLEYLPGQRLQYLSGQRSSVTYSKETFHRVS